MRTLLVASIILAAAASHARAQCGCEPQCGCPQHYRPPCQAPAQPRDFEPEQPRDHGYVEPPPVGIEMGESGGIGITGPGLHFPELFLRLPTLKLPGLVKYRSRARMLIEPRVAPYVEEIGRQEYGERSAPRERDLEPEKDRGLPPTCPAPSVRPGCGCPSCDCARQAAPTTHDVMQFTGHPRQVPVEISQVPPNSFRPVNFSASGYPIARAIQTPVANSDVITRLPQVDRHSKMDAEEQKLNKLERLVDELLKSRESQCETPSQAPENAPEAVLRQASSSEYLQPLNEPAVLQLVSNESLAESPAATSAPAPWTIDMSQVLLAFAAVFCSLMGGIALMCLRTVRILATHRESAHTVAGHLEFRPALHQRVRD